jgi:hypothetical protein
MRVKLKPAMMISTSTGSPSLCRRSEAAASQLAHRPAGLRGSPHTMHVWLDAGMLNF